MEFLPDPQRPRGSNPFRLKCIGCGSPYDDAGSSFVCTNHDAPGDHAMLCASCTPRMADRKFRAVIEVATIVRVSHAAALAVLTRMYADPPRHAEEVPGWMAENDETLEMPAGSARLIFKEFSRRNPISLWLSVASPNARPHGPPALLRRPRKKPGAM